ncbi:MAG: polysaccharide biosynthesis protein [Lachnospiraceae bacterium]|nr:polysaccharide biosynthesis protein [Lachnospiraceae bacterium]
MKKKKSNFIVQGGILAMAGILSRLIGIARRFPMQHIFGDKGNGYYAAAYSVYSLMLIISCYSLPLAVSKAVSSKISKRQYKSAQRVFQCAMIFALTMGGVTFFICEYLGDFLAEHIMEEPMGAMALKVLGPALLTVSVMGVFRGYFQGLGTMMPTAVSQILEQVFVLIGSIAGTYVLYNYGGKVGALHHNEDYAPAYGAAGASIGPVLGSVVGLLFLAFVYVMYRKGSRRRSARENGRVDGYPQIFKLIILTIIPVLLSSTVYNISDVIDTSIFGKVMVAKGMSDVKTDIWGVYTGKYKVLVNVPIALANAMCSSIVPVLTKLMVREEYGRARERIGQAMRFTMIVAFPSSVGLAVLARPIISLLFKGEVDMAVNMLHVGSMSVVFFAISTLTNGVLQGINRMRVPVRNAAIALVIHVVFLYAALQMDMGINAVIYANILFAAIVCILNAMAIRKYMRYNQELVRTFAIPAIASIVMGIVIGLLNMLLSKSAGKALTVFVGIGVGAIVYFAVLILLKGINEHDLRSMPGGRTVLSIARRFRLM